MELIDDTEKIGKLALYGGIAFVAYRLLSHFGLLEKKETATSPLLGSGFSDSVSPSGTAVMLKSLYDAGQNLLKNPLNSGYETAKDIVVNLISGGSGGTSGNNGSNGGTYTETSLKRTSPAVLTGLPLVQTKNLGVSNQLVKNVTSVLGTGSGASMVIAGLTPNTYTYSSTSLKK